MIIKDELYIDIPQEKFYVYIFSISHLYDQCIT